MYFLCNLKFSPTVWVQFDVPRRSVNNILRLAIAFFLVQFKETRDKRNLTRQFTFKIKSYAYATGASVVWYFSLPLINSFNKPRLTFPLCMLCFLLTSLNISDYKWFIGPSTCNLSIIFNALFSCYEEYTLS